MSGTPGEQDHPVVPGDKHEEAIVPALAEARADTEHTAESGQLVLEVRNLVKEFPGAKALVGVDFDVRAGEVHCLLGANGAGKSTLIKCVSGVHTPTEGQILLDGEEIPYGNPAKVLAMGVGTIYQELDLVPDLTVAESIYLGHEPRQAGMLDLSKMRKDARELLTRLDHPRINPRSKVASLRPAAQQVVSIARALSKQVRLLIMDEPSAILDDDEIETMFSVVNKLTAAGVGVIYISHRLDEIRRVGDRVTVLADGATVINDLPPDTPQGKLVEYMVGHSVDQLYPDSRPKGNGNVLLEVRNVTREPDVRDVSFEVHAGEIVGIGGLVGAGRSELLRAIFGVDPRDSGEVVLDGKKLPSGRPDKAISAGLGMAPEDRKSQGLLLGWDLAKNVTLPDLRRFTSRVLLNRRQERRESQEQLRALNTKPDDVDRVVRELSGGNQQKVVLARWLLRECKVLLLDEPTRGVDVATKAELYRVINDLATSGLGVLVVSSELEELVGICTRVLVMREGALVAEVAGDETSEHELLSHAVSDSESKTTKYAAEEVR